VFGLRFKMVWVGRWIQGGRESNSASLREPLSGYTREREVTAVFEAGTRVHRTDDVGRELGCGATCFMRGRIK